MGFTIISQLTTTLEDEMCIEDTQSEKKEIEEIIIWLEHASFRFMAQRTDG